MTDESKIEKELERLKRQIRACGKNLQDSLKKAKDLEASVQAGISPRQTVKSKRRTK